MARAKLSRRRITSFIFFIGALCILSMALKSNHPSQTKLQHARSSESSPKNVSIQNDLKKEKTLDPPLKLEPIPLIRPTKKQESKETELDGSLRRVCGSPAIDGYAHVDPQCLFDSPTNLAWRKLHPEGGKSGEGLNCNIEEGVSIDGLAVGWGINNKKASPEECCQACRDHVPTDNSGPFSRLPCNAWVYCPLAICFEADAHNHTKGDCWLKFTEAPQSPEINARGFFSEDFRNRHPSAPEKCPWISGVLVPEGQTLTNGTWGPRASW